MAGLLPARWLLATPPRPPLGTSARPQDDQDDNELGPGPGPNAPSASDGRSSSPFPSDLQAQNLNLNPRKRHAEDMGQYADQVSRKLRLAPEAQEELKNFSQLSGPQQSVWIAARMLDTKTQVSALVPAESVYHMPIGLEGHVDKTSFLALIDHKAPNYVNKANSPKARVLAYLEKHPSWGLTVQVKHDKSKFDVISLRVRDKLTAFRNLIKSAIEESLGTARDPLEVLAPGEATRVDAIDIVTLCQRILAIGAKVAPDVKVSMEMAARVAYLRFHYQTQVDAGRPKAPRFWSDVDTGLTEIRTTATGGSAEGMTRLFSRALNDDLVMYGPVGLDYLVDVSPAGLD
ncbi:hypothetical protein DFH07DRAFT_766014 [Mycena maculata]|uniref:Uncharacterized protein n=1 Tax=Mycena maculata TaxID=230809 RepID=A0AAD7K882_9AGAR|nr:hypothetical protein DFH07DRAFT_766014 [Mycena maculata]